MKSLWDRRIASGWLPAALLIAMNSRSGTCAGEHLHRAIRYLPDPVQRA